MKKYYDICVKEEYVSNGEQKRKWHNVGKLMELDKGGFMLNIPLLPKLYVFEQKAKNEAVQKADKVSRGEPVEEFPEDKIPF